MDQVAAIIAPIAEAAMTNADVLEAVLAIDPEDHAAKSRDYGRGFADAIRRVREVIGKDEPAPSGFPYTPFWHLHADEEAALAVLTKMACPAPCIGYVNDTGWHLECERKARVALAALRSPHQPEEAP